MKLIAKQNRIAFLCSGNGGNLRAINTAIANGWLGRSSIVAVLTDRHCGANDYAREKQLETQCIDFTCSDQKELISALNACKPDIIVTNVNRIIKPPVVDRYQGKLVNLHYSLLPAFGGSIGQKPVKDALAYSAKVVGTTVHFVDKTLDGGTPLTQTAIPVYKDDSTDGIMDIVFRCGCIGLFTVIRHFRDDIAVTKAKMLIVKGRECFFNPSPDIPKEMNTDRFWSQLQTLESASTTRNPGTPLKANRKSGMSGSELYCD